MVNKNEVLYIISQIDEPEEVVVPKFVARWIEKHNNDNGKKARLSHALEHVFDDTKLSLYIKQQEGDYTETIAKAWLAYPNITIKQDKLYTVEIAGGILTKIIRGNTVEYKVLVHNNDYHFNTYDLENNAIYTTILTEEEIKEADERLWQFAKELISR